MGEAGGGVAWLGPIAEPVPGFALWPLNASVRCRRVCDYTAEGGLVRPRIRLAIAVGIMASAALVTVVRGRALSDTSGSSGTDVTLDVQRMAALPGREAATPQYSCSARILRLSTGEVLASPRIQTFQGAPTSITTTTDSGIKVVLRVLVSASDQLTYEVEITPAEGPSEHHRATIAIRG